MNLPFSRVLVTASVRRHSYLICLANFRFRFFSRYFLTFAARTDSVSRPTRQGNIRESCKNEAAGINRYRVTAFIAFGATMVSKQSPSIN